MMTSDNFCPKCGGHWITHDGDGSCGEDMDQELFPWMTREGPGGLIVVVEDGAVTETYWITDAEVVDPRIPPPSVVIHDRDFQDEETEEEVMAEYEQDMEHIRLAAERSQFAHIKVVKL